MLHVHKQDRKQRRRLLITFWDCRIKQLYAGPVPDSYEPLTAMLNTFCGHKYSTHYWDLPDQLLPSAANIIILVISAPNGLPA